MCELTNFNKAMEDGWEAREIAGQELGDDADCGDYISDWLHDLGYDHETIRAVVDSIAEKAGW